MASRNEQSSHEAIEAVCVSKISELIKIFDENCISRKFLLKYENFLCLISCF